MFDRDAQCNTCIITSMFLYSSGPFWLWSIIIPWPMQGCQRTRLLGSGDGQVSVCYMQPFTALHTVTTVSLSLYSFGVWYDMRCMQELPLLSNKCLSRLKRNQFGTSTWLEMICKAIQTCWYVLCIWRWRVWKIGAYMNINIPRFIRQLTLAKFPCTIKE